MFLSVTDQTHPAEPLIGFSLHSRRWSPNQWQKDFQTYFCLEMEVQRNVIGYLYFHSRSQKMSRRNTASIRRRLSPGLCCDRAYQNFFCFLVEEKHSAWIVCQGCRTTHTLISWPVLFKNMIFTNLWPTALQLWFPCLIMLLILQQRAMITMADEKWVAGNIPGETKCISQRHKYLRYY